MLLTNNKKITLLPILGIAILFPFGVKFGLVGLLVAFMSLFIHFTFFQKNKKLGIILYAGFFLRVIVAVLDDQFKILPYAWDDYFTTALDIKENFWGGYPLFYDIDKSIHIKSYSSFSAFWYSILGDYEIILRLLNCFMGMLIVQRVYKIGTCVDQSSAYIAAGLVAFWPSFILFNSLNMRDTLVILLSFDMVFRFLQNLDTKRFLDFIIIPLELLALVLLRTQNLIVYGVIFFTFFYVARLLQFKFVRVFRPIPLLVLIGVFVVLYNMSDFMHNVFQYLSIESKGRAIGGAAYLVGQTYESWGDVVKMFPLRFVYFCFGPFPWQIKNPFMVLSSLESMLFLFFLVVSCRYIFSPKHFTNKTFFLLIFALVGLSTNALVDSNFGTAIRHKLNYMVFFFIFGAALLQNYKLQLFKDESQI